MNIVNNFANNLKNLRQQNNLTQSELGNKLDITKQIISNYENGKKLPNLYTVIKISNYFNCSIDSLVYNGTEINTSNLDEIYDINNTKICKGLESTYKSLEKLSQELTKLNKESYRIIYQSNKTIELITNLNKEDAPNNFLND